MRSESNSQEFEGGNQENQAKYDYQGLLLGIGSENASPLHCLDKAMLLGGARNKFKENPQAQTEQSFFTQPSHLRATSNNNGTGQKLCVRGRSPQALLGNHLQPIALNGQFDKSKTGMRKGITGGPNGNLHQSSNARSNCTLSWAAPLPANAAVINPYQQ